MASSGPTGEDTTEAPRDPDAETALLEIKDALMQHMPEHWMSRFDASDDVAKGKPFGVDFSRIAAKASDYAGDAQARTTVHPKPVPLYTIDAKL